MAKSDLRLGGGGEYALVADRITLFYERFPDGRIITELVSRTPHEVTFRALVFRSPADAAPAATGWASEREGDGEINTVACLENTETSAIGRALANLGFTAAAQRPSAEEMAKAARARARVAERPAPAAPAAAAAASEHMTPPDLHLRTDLRLLLAAAERAGLRAARAAAVRRLLDEGAARDRLEGAERWLRGWLARRGGAGAGAVAAVPAAGGAQRVSGG